MAEDDRQAGRVRRVTMKDVARAAGVSQSTVSFVLNEVAGMRIAEDTRRRVRAVAEELGYRPRAAGRPSARPDRQAIGVLIDEVATSPMAAISLEGIQEAAWQGGCVAEIAMTGGDPRYEAIMLDKWAGQGIGGVIYASVLTRTVTPPPGLLRHRAVLMNCMDADGRFASVTPAERRGGEAATRVLLDAGHRRIAFVTGEPWMDAAIQRREGFERAMQAAGCAIDPGLVVEGNFLPSGGRAATLALLARRDRPDAIFCANDLSAVGAYEALKESGLWPGRDIGVIGYDDQEIAQHLTPALSSVLLPHREMAQWAVACLLDGREGAREQKRLACPPVLRASHARGRAAPAR